MSSLGSEEIVKIIEDKLLSIRSAAQGDLYHECGRDQLLKQVQAFIEENRPIQLLLPAFPCKSPNREKVCEKLPDAGELYALEYLNDICREISLLYEPGCEFTVWSDGRVFGDLIGVSAEDIATYERLLKYYSLTMTHLQWDSMNNYINTRNGESLVEKYGTATFAFDQWLLKSEDNRQQFSQMRRFIERDLSNLAENKNLSRRERKSKMSLVVEEMIRRNEALTNLLKQHYPNHVRLSIHQHVNDGQKFTIRFFANTNNQSDNQCILRTPWHNVLVINVDGKLNLTPYRQLNLQTEHVPIMFKNQIWCFVQLPSDSPLSLGSTLKLSLLGKSPRFGLSIDLSKKVDVCQLDFHWMKMLVQKFGLVVLRQCQNSLDKDSYLQFCEQFGPILSIKSELNPCELLPLNVNLNSPPEYLPKTSFYNDYVPQHLMLHCVQAPIESDGSITKFVNGRLLLESIEEKDILKWKKLDISSITRQSSFDGQSHTYPMIMSHPKTNENILRFFERSHTDSQSIEAKCPINGSNMDSTVFEGFNQKMQKKMHDPSWCIEHTWNNDDLVIIDNHLLSHSAIEISKESEPTLWGVQVY